MKTSTIAGLAAVLVIAGGIWYVMSNNTNNGVVAPALSTLDYKNVTYVIQGQPVKLVDGRAEVSAAPGSASKTVTQIFGNAGKGDLNGDNIPDLALILTQNTGGSGTFYYVVASLQTPAGGYQGTSAVQLGDRIAPQTTEIRNGQVIVNYADRAPGEPMTTKPSVGVTKYFVVNGTSLVAANKISAAGERCGGNMTTAPTCVAGFHCAPAPGSHLPFGDVGGTCIINTPAVVTPPVACTQDAKVCPDGSAVGRTGPDCTFALCPITPKPVSACLKDSDCSSAEYVCEETSGTGTACASNDPNCVPTHTILSGVCKIKAGGRCDANSDCAAGNQCNTNMCVSPVGRACSGPNDATCPANFQCIQGCGPPVVRPDTPPPGYFCQLNGYNRMCPVCLAKNTLIDTPQGAVRVQDIQKGDSVWTVTASGERIAAAVEETGKTAVPADHKMVELVLADGRTVHVSPGHPTADGRTAGDINAGDSYDGARVVSANRVPYSDGYTYDILPAGATGFYFANGILLGSTLYR